MNTIDKIKDYIQKNEIVLFMKGTSNFPQCGFSATVVNILKQHGVEFCDVNVLEDNELREAIKEYSDWPTIPQIYVRGEFIGGCDILRELHQSGELANILKNNLGS